jgi:hypothetical protein
MIAFFVIMKCGTPTMGDFPAPPPQYRPGARMPRRLASGRL